MNQAGELGFLAADSVGSAEVRGTTGAISASSLFYRLDKDNKLLYGYAAPFAGSPGLEQISEFNRFIENQNEIELYNSTADHVLTQLDLLNYDGTLLYDMEIFLSGRTAKRITLPVQKDTYGTVLMTGDKAGVVSRAYVRRKNEYVLTFPGK